MVLIKAVDGGVELIDVAGSALGQRVGLLGLSAGGSGRLVGGVRSRLRLLMPACARASTSLMSAAFLALTSSSSVSDR